ncbi:hypothetical protein RDWZM_008509 [Blomia tropicalis]|uniref:Cationic amino acid transporter C-terminal domain-containing protein n=1 Tax=Blomia tropicalis TaxID=40697 RepID=A0A9Q0M4D8_BLOTA|nr:High affinity cationic amino acid transporter 1 [Blomia tropicalis]KAJ6217352.1 hypothetical protein RDWZM_008509 [Blomia tropicalis]
MNTILRAFVRRKPIEDSGQESQLNRCLGPIDLTALGIGSTLGVGVYVITGTVAAKLAGPSVVLSFIIAAIASIFAGLCYAEFGARVPKAGSAYIYSYISVGELMAFIIGWNLILEYVIGTASVARSYSNYIDYLFENKIQNFLMQYLKLPASKWFSSYPDIFAFSLTMLLAVILIIGVQESTRFTTIFTGVNILVIIYCVIVGMFKIDTHNWNLSPKEIPPNHDGGKGGFLPFGVQGMISGAATCFYSFVGFDAIATTGEEVLNPQRDIPIGIIVSLLIVTVAYSSVSAVQTLVWPFWDQDQKAPLPYVFEQVGFPFAKNVITIGALAGLSTSLLGAMFPLPRILYAMANDGLLFKFLANINPRFKTPVAATIVSGLFSALMATFFDVEQLAEMMSIGTLLAYSLVAISILILRYKKEEPISIAVDVIQNLEYNDSRSNFIYEGSLLSRIINHKSLDTPDAFSSQICLWLISLINLFILAFNGLMYFYEEQLYQMTLPISVTIAFVSLLIVIIALTVCLARQPMIGSSVSFKVPLVPVLPLLSVFANTYLMVHLSILTWFRFIIWMTIGFVIYFSYGIVKSVGYLTQEERDRLSIVRTTPTSNEFDNETFTEPIE